jgi:hypothetical protein
MRKKDVALRRTAAPEKKDLLPKEKEEKKMKKVLEKGRKREEDGAEAGPSANIANGSNSCDSPLSTTTRHGTTTLSGQMHGVRPAATGYSGQVPRVLLPGRHHPGGLPNHRST